MRPPGAILATHLPARVVRMEVELRLEGTGLSHDGARRGGVVAGPGVEYQRTHLGQQ